MPIVVVPMPMGQMSETGAILYIIIASAGLLYLISLMIAIALLRKK